MVDEFEGMGARLTSEMMRQIQAALRRLENWDAEPPLEIHRQGSFNLVRLAEPIPNVQVIEVLGETTNTYGLFDAIIRIVNFDLTWTAESGDGPEALPAGYRQVWAIDANLQPLTPLPYDTSYNLTPDTTSTSLLSPGRYLGLRVATALGRDVYAVFATGEDQIVQINTNTADSHGLYDASIVGQDSETGDFVSTASIWARSLDMPLFVGWLGLGRLLGVAFGRPVYTIKGPLLTFVDVGSGGYATGTLLFHVPTFKVSQPQAGQALAKLNWGTDIQPVGTANLPGTSDQPVQSNHVHQFMKAVGSDPPQGSTGTLIVYNPDPPPGMIWFPFGGIWIPVCPCPGWVPPVLSGSGSGSGTGTGTGDGGGGVVTPCCGGVAIPETLYASFSPGASAGCECLAGQTVPLFYNSGTQEWIGTADLCSTGTADIRFSCYNSPSWALTITGPSGQITNTDAPASCSPFLWPAADIDLSFAGSGICTGSGRVGVSS